MELLILPRHRRYSETSVIQIIVILIRSKAMHCPWHDDHVDIEMSKRVQT